MNEIMLNDTPAHTHTHMDVKIKRAGLDRNTTPVTGASKSFKFEVRSAYGPL